MSRYLHVEARTSNAKRAAEGFRQTASVADRPLRRWRTMRAEGKVHAAKRHFKPPRFTPRVSANSFPSLRSAKRFRSVSGLSASDHERASHALMGKYPCTRTVRPNELQPEQGKAGRNRESGARVAGLRTRASRSNFLGDTPHGHAISGHAPRLDERDRVMRSRLVFGWHVNATV